MNAVTKWVLVSSLLGPASFEAAHAQPAKPEAQAPSVAEEIKQLEQAWADAMITGDLATVSRIVADDWISGYPGKSSTKADFLASIKAGAHKLETCEFGPRDVKVLGDVAVLQGSATETRLSDGQRMTVRVAYMDVWAKRGARWVLVRSYATKL